MGTFIEQLEYGSRTLERIHSQRHWFESYTCVFEENICGGRHSYWWDKLKGNAYISSVYVEKWFSIWLIVGKGERSLKNEVILYSIKCCREVSGWWRSGKFGNWKDTCDHLKGKVTSAFSKILRMEDNYRLSRRWESRERRHKEHSKKFDGLKKKVVLRKGVRDNS